jgi:hypothetical protein
MAPLVRPLTPACHQTSPAEPLWERRRTRNALALIVGMLAGVVIPASQLSKVESHRLIAFRAVLVGLAVHAKRDVVIGWAGFAVAPVVRGRLGREIGRRNPTTSHTNITDPT